MNTSMMISSGAMQAYQQKIDNTANNVANSNTTGYKRKDHSFSEILAQQINNAGRPNEEIGRLTPQGIRVGYGVKTGLTQTDMKQGAAIETNQPFDLMIQGVGFFQIGTADGVRYTRDGSFHLSPDPNNEGNYHLVHGSGGYLLDQNGDQIELNDDYDVQITNNGAIQLKLKNADGGGFLSDQRVAIVEIETPQILANIGDNLFAVDENVLPEGAAPADYAALMPLEQIQLATGYLEGSNVDLSKEMTELMTSQRSFQLNARALSYADQMLGIANNILK